MGASSAFDEAICEFAVDTPTRINGTIYRAFIKAVREGRLRGGY